jgi:mono/diheme cytochrome c family protein
MNRWNLLPAAVCASLALALAVPAHADELPETNPLSGNTRAIASGKSWYRGICANCHGGRADGQGERGTGADLRKLQLGFRGFVEVVKQGRQVQGRIQGMPAWGGVIDDKTIYEIGAYLETLAIEGADWKQGVVHL